MITSLSKLYDSIKKRNNSEDEPSLEKYLCSFYSILDTCTEKPSYDLFIRIAQGAFHAPPTPFDNSWMERTEPPEIEEDSENSKAIAQDTLNFLIADLRRMKNKGILEKDPVLFAGVISSTGHSWYNFEPSLFLECAARGAVDIAGSDSEQNLEEIKWSEFASILDLGRFYE